VSASLEARRRAVVEALRAVAREPLSPPATVIVLPIEPRADVAERIDPDDATEQRVSVPAVSLDEVRMSAVAAEALFGS
jgi:hypothetical protein